MNQPYVDALRGIQDRLLVEIQTVRSMMQHKGEIGDRVEVLIRDALQAVLPRRIGVSKGFVVDAAGKMSKQMDIILYDRLNTPQIPLPEGTWPQGTSLFPVEGTYACGEVKTILDSTQLDDCIEKRDSYKSLKREAYLVSKSPILTTFNMYGESWEHWQSLFFCLVVESTNMFTLRQKLYQDDIAKNLPPNKRMDGIFALETSKQSKDNCIIYAKIASTWVRGAEMQAADIESVGLLSEPDHTMVSYYAHSPFALFIALITRYLQTDLGSMNIVPYWSGTF